MPEGFTMHSGEHNGTYSSLLLLIHSSGIYCFLMRLLFYSVIVPQILVSIYLLFVCLNLRNDFRQPLVRFFFFCH